MTDNLLLSLYKKPQTVFSFSEISLSQHQIAYQNLKRRIHYLVKTKQLRAIRRGIYAKENFDLLEAANKIYTPSYISLETVLEKEGIVFQKYETIFVCSYLTRKIKIGNQEIFYRKCKQEVLLNYLGIEQKKGYFTAEKERAFLDAVFLYKDYHFDNLKSLDWQKVDEIKKIYNSKILEKRVAEYYQLFQKNNV